MWPVSQVVKTEASHAFDIGSNPVRVTSFFEKRSCICEVNMLEYMSAEKHGVF